MNVLVLTMARSRSSWVTKFFVDAGFHPGFRVKPPDQYNRVGYWENSDLKAHIRKSRPDLYNKLLDGRDPYLYSHGGTLPPEPWVQKVDAFCWPAYQAERCAVVKVRRRPEDILRSCMNTPFMVRQGFSEEQWEQIIARHNFEMDHVVGVDLDTDELLDDPSPIEELARELMER